MVINVSKETAAIVDQNLIKLSGQINMDAVASFYAQGIKSLVNPIEVIDCSNVKEADSSCLALLLYFQSLIDHPLKVLSLPDDLKVLVNLYNLDDVFHFS
uniref:MlaB-like STAS domain-containing protein n=1 Tax=Hydrogenovibrio crunogenus (strain DSM 25203 / XCL-2) TaxID=317025 RepID=Q31GZ5_HYDCU